MSSQLVSLVWDGHHPTLVSVFEKLLVNCHIVDCTIAAGGQKMKAHKEVLSAFSPFFELLFSEETENNPTVIISGISFRDLRSLVDFMYQGKLEVSEERIEDLIDAAECLQIKGLGGGHKEDGSGNISNTEALPKRRAFSSDVSYKLTRKCEREETANIDSKESEANDLNYSNEIPPEKSVVTFGAKKTSLVQNLMSNCDAQNLSIVSNVPLIPVHSTLSEIEMDSSHLQGEYVATMDPESVGDENINWPKRERNKRKRVCKNSGAYAIENVYECSGEESILGLSADISVRSENNVYEDLPLYCLPPAVPSSHLCSRDLVGSSVKNELSNSNVNFSSESVEPVISAVDTQDPLFHSEFIMKSEDDTFVSVEKNLNSEHDEISENVPKNIRFASFSEMQKKVECTEKKNNESSGVTSGCILESIYSPDEHPVKIQRIGRNEPPVGLMPGLPAEVNPHVIPTDPLHTTSVCDRDLPGAIGRDVNNESTSTHQYSCQICCKTFIRKESLNGHMQIHAEDRLFQNDECNNVAVTSMKLNKQRTRSVQKLYKCTVCEFKSVHSKSLRVHVRIHSGVKPYKCSECEYACRSNSNLEVHQRIHSGVKPYECDECDSRFSQLSALKIHQRIHSGVKPYKCTECDYAGSSMGNLKMHQLSHSGVKPYKCTECDYAATTSNRIKAHQRIHSGFKPYKCSECSYASGRKDSLKSHLRTHSNGNQTHSRNTSFPQNELRKM